MIVSIQLLSSESLSGDSEGMGSGEILDTEQITKNFAEVKYVPEEFKD